MAAMNVVHMRVKPGMDGEFVKIHEEMTADGMSGLRNFWVVKTGDRMFTIIGEWDSLDAMAGARSAMIANLDRLRPILEDLGGGRGVTEPWSGEIAAHLAP